MIRLVQLAVFAMMAAAVAAQTPAARSSTAAMLRELDRLEPPDGWLARPPGIAEEQWSYYRGAFGLAPAGNEADEARVGLGRLLFFDPRLSRDRTLSCASCHDPLRGFADGRPTSVGVGGQRVPRNAPTVMNAALQRRLFWDGRVQTLEEQAGAPILNPHEMGMPDQAAVVARVREVEEYVLLFDLAYGREPQFADIARALAAFQRTLIFLNAPFDAFRRGDDDAISAEAKLGLELFREHCTSCHPISLREPLLSDGNFHNVGVGFDRHDHQAIGREAFPKVRARDRDPSSADMAEIVGSYGELGRALISKLEYQVGAFRTPGLRNVALTAPYMHDGSIATLREVVEHYNRGGHANTWQDPQIRQLDLTPTQLDHLVAFLHTLTDTRLTTHIR
ncbi:MAG: cytochrome-c peroxidase [Planctomycetes bacterium]|nr:cytochrome-c peroxidase [Planctomycetota bacterium]